MLFAMLILQILDKS